MPYSIRDTAEAIIRRFDLAELKCIFVDERMKRCVYALDGGAMILSIQTVGEDVSFGGVSYTATVPSDIALFVSGKATMEQQREFSRVHFDERAVGRRSFEYAVSCLSQYSSVVEIVREFGRLSQSEVLLRMKMYRQWLWSAEAPT